MKPLLKLISMVFKLYITSKFLSYPGLPRSVSGLRVGPDGWAKEQERVSWRPLLFLILLSAILRLYKLDTDLWLDEIATVVHYMRLPLDEIMTRYGGANQHLLNSILGHISLSILGESSWSVRLPAVLFGVGGVAALYYLARVITNEREALITTALLAVNYHHVWFSQNARGYTGMIFFMLLGTGLLLRCLALNRSRDWILYTLSMPFGILSLLNSAFVFASHIPAYASTFIHWPSWKQEHWPLTIRLIVCTLLAVFLTLLAFSQMLPEIVNYFLNTAVGNEMGWTNPIEFIKIAMLGLTKALGPMGMIVVLTGTAIACIGWVSYWRQSYLLSVLLTLPVVFNVLALIILDFGAYPRSFLYVLPLGLLFVVRGVFIMSNWVVRRFASTERMRKAAVCLAPLLVGLMLLVSVVSELYNYLYPKQDYTGALQHVMNNKEPEDIICAVGYVAGGYKSYYGSNLAFPKSLDELQVLQSEGRSLWVLYSFTRDMRRFLPEMYDYIQTDFDLVATFPGTLGDGNIYVARRTRYAK